MPISLSDVEFADFHQIATSLYEASLVPRKPVMYLACRDLNNRDASIAETQEFCEKHMWGSPSENWVKVVDTDDSQPNKIVGGAMYELHETNPFENEDGKRPIAWHYPDGAERELVTQLIESGAIPRRQKMARPHIFVQTAWTHPAHRRRGVAALFMQRIVAEADSRGLYCWLTATPVAIPLYEKYGFRVVTFGERRASLWEDEQGKDREGRVVDEEYRAQWKAAEERILPIALVPMWRPKEGVYIPGVTKKPWEE
ncbi:hypothetical protein EV356DRAFT_532219 [Viridothelium virens]|uniref:N-acetyltransferase domain-containing protein n=1 Tax=Viridothelium virens TaxID=1048519 RepID=A0A6A6HCI8_VIRVR|nr:hypothetical protein EV356DRAFT_532219 [Viridothelium virens]